MDYEIWDSTSGNRLATFRSSPEALLWVLDLWTHQGDPALEGISLGDQEDRWVVSGDRLKQAVRELLWAEPAVMSTSSSTSLSWEPGRQFAAA
jgi:hypothetical protein